MALKRQERRLRIKMRLRKRISGTPDRPRMSVYRSNKQISVQVIDDVNGVTLASATSQVKEIAEQAKITKTEQARLVGKLAAKAALDKGITAVVFDRNGYLYHGRVKALADAAREGGLKF